MSTQLIKLRTLLRELFQLDQADLDFGIYRIMALKRDEITRFLDHDLLPQVRAAFDQFRPADKAHTEQQLAQAIAQAEGLGVDPTTVPKVKELRAKLGQAVDVTALESAVYDHLYDFFRRYYKDGDFISLRRYKEGVYAIPYEGEEVKLYWANHDQYYIKTTDTLTNYAFKTGDGRRVRFELAAAAAERDNVKPAAGQERRFLFHEEAPVDEDVDGLVVRFEYRPDDQGRKQAELNDLAAQGILNTALAGWRVALAELAPTDSNPGRTVLDKHIAAYAARNTFDYFIHKDLGGFLRRELDFYIKNEVLHLDDIDGADMAQVEQALSLAKALRMVAHKIIDFLTSIEDFQKRLWLKKKFVVETNWCITLDRVPEEFYPEIATNDAQREEWVRLFNIDEIKGDLLQPDYSVPISVDFLCANPFLVLDTQFFGANFAERLLNRLDNLDEQMHGLLVHSDNFHAIGLLQLRYDQQIQCIYIDPPFNLGANADFLYRTDYKDSTWVTLLNNRISLVRSLLSNQGLFFLRCDANGNHLARFLCDGLFGPEMFQAELNVQRIRKNVTGQGRISMPLANDSLYLYFRSQESVLIDPYLELPQTRESYWRRIDDSAGFRNPPERLIFGRLFTPYKRDAHFKYSQASIDRMIGEGKIRLLCKDCGFQHSFGPWHSCPKCGQDNPVPQYKVEATDKKILDTNWMDISGYSSQWGFSTENSESLLNRVLKVASDENDLVLDFFAGSGTTMAVAQKTGRKWIGIEMGQQFDKVILRRMKSVLRDLHGNGGMFKYVRLESYEDSLDNLSFQRTTAQQSLLDDQREAREDFMLHYLLDLDTRGSPSLLDVQRFANPFDYKLKINRNYEQSESVVDLVETFSYLIGLRVDHMAARIHRTADFERDEHGRLVVRDGRTRACQPGEGWTFRAIQGRSPAGEKVLIVWRTLRGDPEQDNAMLDLLFARMDIRPRDQEFDLIYVNGDNNLENLRRPDETWKVRLIEEDFHRLMWDVQDV